MDLSAHAHLLRHTFAVVTLEQLQRAHISTLAELNSEQRGHYTRIFGDPLDWVRRRLGHRSIVTPQTYLHGRALVMCDDDLDLASLLGTGEERPTQLYNGYGRWVADLYRS